MLGSKSSKKQLQKQLTELNETNESLMRENAQQKKLNEESILVPNTYVVHKFHGIGLYEGTEVKKIKDVDKDYLSI